MIIEQLFYRLGGGCTSTLIADRGTTLQAAPFRTSPCPNQEGVQTVLKDGLSILGIEAPEKM